jgi:protein TonB
MSSRRRRQRNPLLARIILISIGVHIVVLPILAYFGAFKNIASVFHKPVEIILAPPPLDKQKEVAKKEPKKAPKLIVKGAGAKKSAGEKGKPLNQRVVAANVTAGGSGGSGPTIINPDKGAAPGTLPTGPTTTTPTKTGSGGTGTAPVTKPATQPEVETKPATTAPAAPTKPHVPVMTEVAATFSPQPDIPDDLRDADLDTKVTVQVMVSPDGAPGDVKISQSSGNQELDSLAVDTAKKWRFKAATKDGVGIESRVMLHIEFQVQ